MPSRNAPSAPASIPAPAVETLVPEIGRRADPSLAAGHALAVQRMFDRVSPTYDRLNRVLSFGIDRRWRERALATLLEDLPPGPLLDLCAGTGDLAKALATRAPGRPLLAADFSRNMLAAGRAVSGAQPMSLSQADAMRLPFCDGAFAGAVCGFGIRNVTDPEVCMREVYRCLRPGGVFVVLEFFRPTRLTTHAFHTFYGRLLLPAVGALMSGQGSAYRYLSNSMRGFMTRGEFASAMARTGFRDVTGCDLTLGIASIVRGVK